MQSLPLLVSLALAALVAPAAIERLREHGYVRHNYRGATVAFPAGISITATALVALAPLALLERLAGEPVFRPGTREAVAYVVGVALLGVLDDLFGDVGTPRPAGERRLRRASDAPRGWRGHARAAAAGKLTTGALKAVGSLGLALLVLSAPGLGDGRALGEYLLATVLLVLATNLFNLLDLRPGRSIKALLLLGAGLCLGTFHLEPLWTLGLFLGPIAVLLPLDLRERGMLGDAGSNAVGAVAGLWLVLALSTEGQAIALAVVVAITVYGEFRSLSALIERTPLLRQLDSLGRMRHA